MAQFADAVVEIAGCGGAAEVLESVGVGVDYVDKPDCQSCRVAECPHAAVSSWW
jgi:hypothetical protein